MTPPAKRNRIELPRPIGYVASPLQTMDDCPRQPDEAAPPATLVLDHDFEDGLAGLGLGDHVIVVTWLHLANRGVLTVHPRGDPTRDPKGVFATRSEARPNPIGLHHTEITHVDVTRVQVNHLEALDGTPILDIKPALGPIPDR